MPRLPPSMNVGDTLAKRYELCRRLGEGGMGMVFLARDRERGTEAALKTLLTFDPENLYRLKEEFRSLADLSHRNLVRYYELHLEASTCFFTMELVDGVPFTDFVAPGTRPDEEATRLYGQPPRRAPADPQPGSERRRSPCDVARLRGALAQLCEGVAALHASGRLHRDLKPSNVLVARDGRVVVLDLGLVTRLEPRDPGDETHAEGLSGTPRYMAPEQVSDPGHLTPATDWYAVGSILFEVLTGHLPFSGTLPALLTSKLETETPPRPSELVDGVPEDLDDLCFALLARDPGKRPTGAEILATLARGGPAGAASEPLPEASAFVGRELELARLDEALARVRHAGLPGVVLLRGRSGVGKSALAEHFLDRARARHGAIALGGRCFERESVPFKALDGLIDALARRLRQLPREEAAALVPRGVHALTRTFPVLARVEAIAAAPGADAPVPDQRELRRRAFRALEELLGRIADRWPLVLWVDDLQWGDADSGALLASVLAPPDAPALLLIATARSEDEDAGPLVRALRAGELLDASVDTRELTVEPLSASEAEHLARALARPDDPHGAERARAIALEAGGNPYLVAELAQHPAATAPAAPSLEGVLRARLDELDAPERALLELVSVSGKPLARDAAFAAARLGADALGVEDRLRVGRLVRLVRTDDAVAVEPYHDRVRETVIASLDPERLRGRHASLAEAMTAAGADPERLAEHHLGAGQLAEAGRHALAAADQAARALAFDRAARLYELALEHGRFDAATRREALVRQGDALANAGRGAVAAEAYLAALEGAASAEVLELKRRAGEQLLRSGDVDRGLAVMREVVAAVGMRMPASPRATLAAIVGRRLRMAVARAARSEREASACDPGELARVDTSVALVLGLQNFDPLLGAYFQARQMAQASRLGEPFRLCRALTCEGYFTSLAGSRSRTRAARILDRAEALVERLDDPYLRGLKRTVDGAAALYAGEWRRSLELSAEAQRVLRDECTGVAWELTSSQITHLAALLSLGRPGRIAELVHDNRREAQERGDRFATTFFTLFSGYAHLAVDDVEGARAAVREGLARWTIEGFRLPNLTALVVGANTDLYDGTGHDAWLRIRAAERAIRRSMLLRNEFLRVNFHTVYARAALQAAAAGHDRDRMIAFAEREVRGLEREVAPTAHGLARALRASLRQLRGDRDGAIAALEEAAGMLAAADYRVFEMACERLLGAALGGDAGERLVRESEERMRAAGFRDPLRFAATCWPGIAPP